MIKVWCDGSITGSHWGKKGERDSLPHAWAGWYAINSDGALQSLVHHHSLDLGEGPLMSANVGEYMAVRSALHWLAVGHRDHAIFVYSDSQLVMRQLSGEYNVHNPHLRQFYECVKTMELLFLSVDYVWIRREENKVADRLSKCLQPQFGGRALTAAEVFAIGTSE